MTKKILTVLLILITFFSITTSYCADIKSFDDVATEYGITPSELEDAIEKGISPNDYKTQEKSSKSLSLDDYIPVNDTKVKTKSSMVIPIILLIVFLVVVYFIPTAIAVKRKHPNRFGIVIVNIFLGWSLIGWVVALVWAVTDSKPKTSNNKYDDLEKLQNLKANGTITEKEFEAEKQRLLK